MKTRYLLGVGAVVLLVVAAVLVVQRGTLGTLGTSLSAAVVLSNGAPVAPSIPAPYTCVTNYYVSTSGSDSNNGTSAGSPWLTISHAISVLLAVGGTHGGACVNVASGTYAQSNYASGLSGSGDTPTGYLVFRSTTPHGATIQVPASDIASATGNGFRFDNASYIVIDGFTIVGDVVTTPAGADIENGISLNSYGSPGSHIKIINNVIHDHGGGGIEAVHTDYLVVEGNVVYNTSNTSQYQTSGISSWQAVASDSAAGFHNVISDNVVFNNSETDSNGHASSHSDGNGITIDDFNNTQNGSSYGAYAQKTLIENNLAYNNGGAGIHVFLSGGVTVRNNTVYNNYLFNNTGTWLGDINAQGGVNNIFVNNISYANPSANPNNTAYGDHQTTGDVWLNNLSYNGTAGQASWNGSNNVFTTANGNILGANPLFTNVSGNDFTLQSGSPAIGKGTSADGAPTGDLAGNTRSGALDLGAYTFTGQASPPPPPPAAPTCTLSLNPSSITTGSSATLSWSSANATALSITGIGVVSISGSQSVSPQTTTTYTATATGAGGSGTCQTTLTVTAPAPTPPAGNSSQTTASISANPATVASGGSSTLTWTSSNATACYASGTWSGNLAVSGTRALTNLTAPGTYNIICIKGGSVANASAAITIGAAPPPVNTPSSAPTCALAASPATVSQGQSATLSWTTTNATTGSIDASVGAMNPITSGSVTVSPSATTAYIASVSGAGGSTTCGTTVTYQPTPPAPIVPTSPSTGGSTSGGGSSVPPPPTPSTSANSGGGGGGGGGFSTLPTSGTSSSHASLTAVQVQAILSLLQSFSVSQSTITTVSAILSGTAPTPSTSVTSVATHYTFASYLGIGSRGAAVTALQQILIEQDLLTGTGTTGYFGLLTQQAVEEYQTQHALAPVGYLGPKTRALLSN